MTRRAFNKAYCPSHSPPSIIFGRHAHLKIAQSHTASTNVYGRGVTWNSFRRRALFSRGTLPADWTGQQIKGTEDIARKIHKYSNVAQHQIDLLNSVKPSSRRIFGKELHRRQNGYVIKLVTR